MLTCSSYPMDPGPHHPSTYNHHHHYPFLPAAGPPTAGGDTLLFLLAIPAGWLVRLVAFLGERVISAVLTLVVLPGATLVGELRTVPAAAVSLARRAAVGVLAAAFTFAALAVALVASLLLGFVLIRHWVEDPVTVRQPLYFDYTEPQPSAAVALVPPAGHSVRVSMSLLLPDSDHNRQIGVFQIKTEAITPSGSTVASATQPYMLRYKSAPVRLAQSALTIVPLALGMRSESQSATLKLLQYWEGHGRHKRTRLIRVSLQPRAMTVHLPQVYRAEITVQTALPWFKAVARSLKWTMCVWLSFWVYVILSLLAVRWVWPLAVSAWDSHRGLSDRQVNGKTIAANQGGGDIGQSSHEGSSRGGAVRWRDRRGRRKAQQTPHGSMVELKLDEGSSYSSAVAETDEVVDDES
ncbi:seipin-1-like [Triticum dicoccoides]|uniref:seipin-1-like n=1 Tax=Triticum dicoccoides TaxID=85692 RepID=UPI00188EA0FC|nr:seipin-1-like [Triticum dicoccoides]